MNSALSTWASAVENLRQSPKGSVLSYKKCAIVHPVEVGARRSAAWPQGQLSDYRFPPDHVFRGTHVREFENYWTIELEATAFLGAHPNCEEDNAIELAAVGAVIGGAIGVALGRSAGAAAVGMCAGALITLLVAEDDQRSRTATAAAMDLHPT